MKITPQMIWDGLSAEDQLAIRGGQYDARFPNLKKVCIPVIADAALVDVLSDFIAVDISRTDS